MLQWFMGSFQKTKQVSRHLRILEKRIKIHSHDKKYVLNFSDCLVVVVVDAKQISFAALKALNSSFLAETLCVGCSCNSYRDVFEIVPKFEYLNFVSEVELMI